ncbi:MAG: peptidoglycan DD-metalloendopeptidase family protein [Muribaculaceae bacterium]|nr:peptidoglycan DD-metalloendopeptidase family protein [Muribaculaceae bacterium]
MQILSSFGASSPNSPLDYVTGATTTPKVDPMTEQMRIIAALPTEQPTRDVTQPSSALTGILASIESIDPESSPLDFVVNGQTKVKADGLGVLTSITDTYTAKSYYASDSWGQSDRLTSTPLAPSLMSHKLFLPGKGRISSRFGYRAMDSKVHKGIDIAMPVGDTVRAVMPGVIESISYEHKGYGHYVTVKHDNGMQTRYAHLSNSLVATGQRVEGNQPIALSGNTGKSTGPHLHFEIRYLGQAIDPASVINFNSTLTRSVSPWQTQRKSQIQSDNQLYASDNKREESAKRTYIVRLGDTIEQIAARFGISEMKLRQLNNIMDGTTIQPGQMLIIK